MYGVRKSIMFKTASALESYSTSKDLLARASHDVSKIDFVCEQFAEDCCFGAGALRLGWLGWLRQLRLHARHRGEQRERCSWLWSRTRSTTAGHLTTAAPGSCLRKATVAVHDAVG